MAAERDLDSDMASEQPRGVSELRDTDVDAFRRDLEASERLAAQAADSIAQSRANLRAGKRGLTKNLKKGTIPDNYTEIVSIEAQKSPHESEPVDPIELLGRVALAFEAMQQQQDALDAAKDAAQTAVNNARQAGVSWRRIGDLTGVTSVSAYARWDPEGRRKNRESVRRRRGDASSEPTSP